MDLIPSVFMICCPCLFVCNIDPSFRTSFDGYLDEIHFETPSVVRQIWNPTVCSYSYLQCLKVRVCAPACLTSCVFVGEREQLPAAAVPGGERARSGGGRGVSAALQRRRREEEPAAAAVLDPQRSRSPTHRYTHPSAPSQPRCIFTHGLTHLS